MTLPVGQISFGQVNTELGLSATTTISLNQASVRALVGVPSGQIAMSNLQGKSSVSYWITVIGGSTPYSLEQGRMFAGYGATTWIPNIANTSPPKTVNFRLTDTGTLSSSTGYTSSPTNCVTQHTSGDMYVGLNTDYYPIAKLNSSGTVQWAKYHTATSSTYFLTCAVNSANTYVYYTGQGRVSGSSTFSFMKIDASTGVYSWQRRFGADDFVASDRDGVGVDSSDNVYFSTTRTDRGVLGKYDSSGNKVFLNRNADTSLSEFALGFVTSSGECYAQGSWSSTASIIKFDSSGNISWQRRVVNTSYLPNGSPITVDSSGNVYFVFTRAIAGTGRSYIFKYNSSGTLQWQRQLYSSGTLNIRALDARNSGILKIKAFLANSGPQMIVAQLPSDGSKTGTYNSITYEASTETETAGSASAFSTLALNATTITLAFTDYTVALTTPPTYPLTKTSVP